jgi:hypothetical protein
VGDREKDCEKSMMVEGEEWIWTSLYVIMIPKDNVASYIHWRDTSPTPSPEIVV